jgi:dUTP pyrophosphatase
MNMKRNHPMIDVDDYKDNVITVKYAGETQPSYQSHGAAGCDVTASENTWIPKGGWAPVPTGLSMEIPKGYECQVRSRSGLAAKEGIFVLNGVGTIDSDYRGEVKVILANMGKNDFLVEKGMRVAQLVFSKIPSVIFVKVSAADLANTKRSASGFGSTGK